MPDIDVWIFIAGLGIFLLGIGQMEAGIKNLAGKSFRHFLKKHTQNPIKAILVGVFITAIMQSSSVVSLMVLAFVGAGIIPLRNAIGIIFGTNLGTTMTGWIVASIGFKFPIDAFALPFLGIGGILITFFGKRVLFPEIGRFLVGFGALFMGLDYMKNAVDLDTVSMSFFENLAIIPHVFFPIGIILTAIIQSSSATMAITLSALYAGIIPIEVAAAIVIGSDLGTTTTVVLGGLKGSFVKRQVAFGHVGFNLISAILALILLYPLLYLVTDIFAIQDPLFQLVAFHSSFNLLGILVLTPFIGPFSRLLQKLIRPKTITLSPILHQVPAEVTEGAIEAIRQEGEELLERIKKFRFSVFNEDKKTFSQLFDTPVTVIDQYRDIQQKEGEIIAYFLKINQEKINTEDAHKLHNIIHGIKRMTLSAKKLKNVLHTVNALKESDNDKLEQLKTKIQEQYSEFYAILKTEDFAQDLILSSIESAYRENVQQIYHLVQEEILSTQELTSYLHLNSEIKSFKENFLEAWQKLHSRSE
jgi:phosphate:Na+ symporter